ncbi:MAG: 2-C-methyl-D-erythritol 4-phosphate cytidylyltransferase [Candidatus Omnitrophota bacterium]|nr:2-C-methyl-D-erythritol 4-phosphate cytidylyltransferase [Candidatus Omnitrophota bacterium]
MIEISAIVPAAGKGERMAGKKAKPYLILVDKPILAHTLLSLEKIHEIKEIIVVVSSANKVVCRRQIINKYSLKKVKKIVTGGSSRTQSVYRGLEELDPGCDLVLIHDGIRPFVTSDIIRKVAWKAVDCGAALSAVPVISTVKKADQRLVVDRTLIRNRLWLAQTPQVFRRDLIQRAYCLAHKSKKISWDDAGLVEAMGHPVKLVKGEADNIKITTPRDLLLAELILRQKAEGRRQKKE